MQCKYLLTLHQDFAYIMMSKVTDANSTKTINFLLGINSDRATNDVRNAIAQIRQSLPQDINVPVVQRLDFAGGPIITYVVKSDRPHSLPRDDW